MRICTLFVFLYAFSGLLFSCDKEPDVIIEKEIITVYDTLLLLDTVTQTIYEYLADTATTFILVRHAETTGGGSNPGLSAAGQQRADALRRMLTSVPLQAVFSTNYNRTLQTAQPVAGDKELEVKIYDPFAPGVLIEQCLSDYPEGAVLIVGHSNTTPAFMNALTASTQYTDLSEQEYDNLFIVHKPREGNAKVTHLRYGE